MKIGVVIPAFDEQLTVGRVVARCFDSLDASGRVRVVVADNGSRDLTAAVARQAGAEVVSARPRGYGQACLAAIEHLDDWPDVVLFVDADGSSRPEEAALLLKSIESGQADLVIGFRPRDAPMTPPQRWGTRIAVGWIRLRWSHPFRDIGPFRAIRRTSLNRLGMTDTSWGWTVEMQILALRGGLRIEEVPVSWEKRMGGTSKISGTVGGVLRAGARIVWTLAKYSVRPNVKDPSKGPRRL